jgi:hypothetical protein
MTTTIMHWVLADWHWAMILAVVTIIAIAICTRTDVLDDLFDIWW